MKTKPKRLWAVLLTLCLALSFVPITAFADSGAYAVKFYPGDYGTMTKNDQIPFVYYDIDYDVNKPYYYKLDISETETLSFASSIINVLLPNSGYEFAYWTANATAYQVGSGTAIPAGTALSSDQLQNKVTIKSDVTFTAHFKQISEYPDDSVITSAAVQNVKFNYQPGDAPQATAEVLVDPSLEEYEIAYECWEEMENGEPVAFWYSDESKYTPSMKKITQFEEGKTYMYSIELREKNGYTFADNCSVTINGNPLAASANVVKTVDGLFAMNVETIRPQATKEISVIEINNATLTFKDGDKPVFTGTVPENDQYAFRCEWWSLDENTGIVSTEPEWGGDIYTNKITAFESGKTYHYGVYVTAYTADISPDAKLKINGQEVEYTRIGDESDTQSFWVETDLSMMPTTAGASDYKIIEGANGAWTQNSDGTLTFRANGDFSKFTGVKVDGTLIDAKNYTAVSGSTVITLKADYLKTLSVGTHKLTVVYTDGECSTNFVVKQATSEKTKPTEGDKTDTTTSTGGKDTKSPQTGDNSSMFLWIALLFASGGAGILATVCGRKKKSSVK